MPLQDCTPRNIIFHDISCLEDAPLQVRELVASFGTRTLPPGVSEKIRQSETLADYRGAGWVETETQLLSEGRKSGAPSDNAINDALEHLIPDVLSAVRLAQHQIAKKKVFGGFSRVWTSVVITLVETCLKEACPRAYVLEDASFALSRPQFPCHDPRLRFLPRYSTATFAFVPLSGDQDEDELELTSGNEGATDATTLTDYLNALPDAPGTESSSSEWTPSDSEFSSEYDWTFEKFEERNARRRRARLERLDDQTLYSHYSGNSTCTDEECGDAEETELLAHQDSPKLCVLVIAPPHRIAVALQSAVCHRLACGVSQPVLGLAIAPDSPTVQLAAAWPERIDTIDGGLRDVHIAISASGTGRFPMAYNICDVESAFLLAASTLTLMKKLDSETAGMTVDPDTIVPDHVSWRADRLVPADEEADKLGDFVRRWLEELPPSLPNAQCNEAILPSDGEPQSAPSVSNIQSTGPESFTAPEYSQCSSAVLASGTSWLEDGSSPPRKYSLSAMAGKKPHEEEGDRSWHWRFDRRVVTHTIPPPWALHTPHVQKIYVETRLKLIKDFYKSVSLVPSDFDLVIPDLSNLKDRHLEALSYEFQEAIADLPRDSPNTMDEQLRHKFSSVVLTNIESILRVVTNARLTKTHPEHVYLPKASFRRFWDVLLACALDDLEGSVVVGVLYEKTLKMPRNDMYDAVCSLNKHGMGIFGSAFSAHMKELNSETRAYQKYTDDTSNPSFNRNDAATLMIMCSGASTRDIDEKLLDRSVMFYPGSTEVYHVDQKCLTKRHFEDPHTGTCDAAGVFKVPGFFEGIPSGEDFKTTTDLHDFSIIAVASSETAPESGPAKPSESAWGISLSGRADIERTSGIITTASDVSSRSAARDLHVPFLTVAHKKDNGGVVEACNQARACMTGVLRFLHSLGITRVPVYTLLTEGTVGVVIFGWCEDEEHQDDDQGARYTVPVVHIMERNAPTFDISKPIDAITFAAFLFRLSRVEAPKLYALVSKACEELREGTRVFVPWTQDQQNRQPKRSTQKQPAGPEPGDFEPEESEGSQPEDSAPEDPEQPAES